MTVSFFGKEGQDAMYIFVYFRDPARDISDQGFIGLRFNFAKYRSRCAGVGM